MAPTILLTDDEANIRRMLGALLESEGFRVVEAANGPAALAAVERQEPDAVLLDLLMPPGPDGLQTLATLRERGIEAPIIMMSGKAQLSDAVRATKLGAFQFLEKPLSPEAVLTTLKAALDLRRTRAENRQLRAELGQRDDLVGTSAALNAVRELVAQVAPTDARVLISGESGTGKELVAAAIHRGSRRSKGPFVAVNCAAIPRELLESEMFGHERGAFTGATERRLGRFELADDGTLFLDEIGDLSLEAQAKLLRTLETGDLQRVGGNQTIHVDVRVIAATHRRLEEEAARGRFREDLLFRLNIFPIRLPPLRERLGDLPLLVAHLAERARPGRAPEFSTGALAAMSEYRWPGNVRELSNFVERLSILGGATISEAEVRALLPQAATLSTGSTDEKGDGEGPALGEILDDHERGLIASALTRAGGNVAVAARSLRIDRGNLYRRMRRLGMVKGEI